MARVEEPGLRIDARLLFEARHVQRPVDEHERRSRERNEPNVSLPEAGDADPERGEHEIGRDVRDREQAGLTRSMSAPEVEHQGEQKVVEPHEDETGREPGERCAGLNAVERQDVLVPQEPSGPPGRQRVEGVVANVERLDVPGEARPEPLRDVLHDAHQRHELRWQQ